MITSQTRRAGEPTQVRIDISTTEGTLAGLRANSVVNCVNLFTIEQSKILRTSGQLSGSLVQQIDASLKASLYIP